MREFPEFLKTDEKDILRNLFEDIFYRDILVRNDIRNESALKSMMAYLISNIGKEISYNKLKQIIKVKSGNTVIQFMNAFEDAYFLFSLKKFDFSLKKQIINPKKIYCIDNGFFEANAFSFSGNEGRLLENLVFLELKRNNKEIYFHRGKYECDFLIKEKNSISDAIQVCYRLHPDNKERELNGLLEALSAYDLKKGVILTHNQEDHLEIEGKQIIIMPVWKWILR